jgi:hypothetical protein
MYECETLSLTVREEHKLRVKNGVFWVVTPCGSPHGVTTQKTPFFIDTAVKTSNLT